MLETHLWVLFIERNLKLSEQIRVRQSGQITNDEVGKVQWNGHQDLQNCHH